MINDEVRVTGQLTMIDGVSTLQAVEHGRYGQIIQDAGGLSVRTDLPSGFTEGERVTVRGKWDGESVRDAFVTTLADPLKMPEHLGDRVEEEIVPSGRLTKNDVLAPAVLDVNKTLSDASLLFYATRKLSDGWIAVACASDAEPVTKALTPLLGKALTVVQVDWARSDLEYIDSAFTSSVFGKDLLFFGSFIDPAGQFRSHAFVRIVTSEAAAILVSAHPQAFVLTSWIQKV